MVRREYAFNLTLLLLICFGSSALAATGTIQGKVTDIDGYPIIGATVAFDQIQFSQITNQNGEYRIDDIPEGTYTLRVTALSYAALTVTVVIQADKRSIRTLL